MQQNYKLLSPDNAGANYIWGLYMFTALILYSFCLYSDAYFAFSPKHYIGGIFALGVIHLSIINSTYKINKIVLSVAWTAPIFIYFLSSPTPLAYILFGLILCSILFFRNFYFSTCQYRFLIVVTLIGIIFEFLYNIDYLRLNVDGFGWYRPLGPWGGPNATAVALYLCVLGLLLKNKLSVSYIVCALVGLVMTGSRTPIGGVIFMLLYFAMRSFKASIGFLFFLSLCAIYAYLEGYDLRLFDLRTLRVSLSNRFADTLSIFGGGTGTGSPPDIGLFSLLGLSWSFLPFVITFVFLVLRRGYLGFVFLVGIMGVNFPYVMPLNILVAAVFYEFSRRGVS